MSPVYQDVLLQRAQIGGYYPAVVDEADYRA
jgi:hypothetical protein